MTVSDTPAPHDAQVDQWSWWLAALAGNRGELTRGDPKSGFYRTRDNRAAAIWRDDEGTLWADVKPDGYCPRLPDEIDEAFGSWSMRPVSHETYAAFVETGNWPDSIEPLATIGDNSQNLAPHEAIEAQINELEDNWRRWFKSLRNGISNDDEDAKSDNYAKKLAELKTKAEDTRTTEKKPHLEAGRQIDATWKPIVDKADAVKKAVLAPTLQYRKDKADRIRREREAEIERQREENRKAAEAARAANPDVKAAPVAPVILPPAPKTGLRKVKVVQIHDLAALAAKIAALGTPHPDFLEVCTKIARKWLDAGVEVPGATLEIEERPN